MMGELRGRLKASNLPQAHRIVGLDTVQSLAGELDILLGRLAQQEATLKQAVVTDPSPADTQYVRARGHERGDETNPGHGGKQLLPMPPPLSTTASGRSGSPPPRRQPTPRARPARRALTASDVSRVSDQ